ncbi:unnamed protein product, partial [marine sediment metagenome]
MRALGRSPFEANAAAKAGVNLGAPGQSPEELATARREELEFQHDLRERGLESAAERKQEADERRSAAKAEATQAEREGAISSLNIPEDLQAAVRSGALSPIQAFGHANQRRKEGVSRLEKTIGGVGKRVGGALSDAGSFLERLRKGGQEFLDEGQEDEAARNRRLEVEGTRELEAEDAIQAKSTALQAKFGISAEEADVAARGGVTPATPRIPADPTEGLDLRNRKIE